MFAFCFSRIGAINSRFCSSLSNFTSARNASNRALRSSGGRFFVSGLNSSF